MPIFFLQETNNPGATAILETYAKAAALPVHHIIDDKSAIEAKVKLVNADKGLIFITHEQSRGNDFKMTKNAYCAALIDQKGPFRIADLEQFVGRGSRDMDVPQGVVLYVNAPGERLDAKTILETREQFDPISGGVNLSQLYTTHTSFRSDVDWFVVEKAFAKDAWKI